jgi:hypothetical protein
VGVQVAWNYDNFASRFPEFSQVLPAQMQQFFNEATLYQRNDAGGPVDNPVTQAVLLGLMTAHICALNTQSQGDPTPGAAKDANSPVGRISDASQGSVSAAFDFGSSSAEHKVWACQTRYGAAWWAATRQFRTARYFAPPERLVDPWPGAF